MDSKLRDKIAEALAVQGVTDGYICDKTKAIADSILSLLAPVLAAAEKWRTLVRISKCSQIVCIEGTCPHKKLCNPQMPLCGEARDLMLAIFDVNKVVDALEGEGEKG
jgi:hypothetical protein